MLELLTSHRRWGDFHDRGRGAGRALGGDPGRSTGPDAVRAFFALYGDKQGRPRRAGATRPPATSSRCARSRSYLPEARFIHLIRDGRDVALSVLKQSFGPADDRGRGREAGGAGSSAAAPSSPTSASTWRSSSRTWSSTPRASCGGSASSSSSTSTRRCSATTRPPSERLKEKARELPRGARPRPAVGRDAGCRATRRPSSRRTRR